MRFSTIVSFLPLALGAPQTGRAPLLRARDADTAVADTYIVKFKDDSALAQADNAVGTLSLGVDVVADRVFSGVFNGFSGKLDDQTLDLLRDHPDVEYIEQDTVVRAYAEQQNAPWSLARLSTRPRGATSYFYEALGGTGACAYVIDTGIDITHPEFEGRAGWAANFVDSSNTDGNGHGTFLAGLIGGRINGVAKKVKLYSVKVLNSAGSGTIAGIISAIDFVPGHAASQSCPNGAYVTLALGGSFSLSLNNAVANLVRGGIFVAAAAGGSNTNVANTSPASEPSACTAGWTDRNDNRASASNYGPLVDIWAPGQTITSTWPGGSTNTLSGSSLATAYITGLGAYIGSVEGTTNAGGICARIQALATPGIVGNLPAGTPNLFAFNGWPDL